MYNPSIMKKFFKILYGLAKRKSVNEVAPRTGKPSTRGVNALKKRGII